MGLEVECIGSLDGRRSAAGRVGLVGNIGFPRNAILAPGYASCPGSASEVAAQFPSLAWDMNVVNQTRDVMAFVCHHEAVAKNRALAPQVGDHSSLLTFAAVAVLRDPLLRGTNRLEPLDPDDHEAISRRLGVSPPTIRDRLHTTFTPQRITELEGFIKRIEHVRYGEDGGQLWFLARRLFGTSDDALNDRIHPEWWTHLRDEPRLRTAGDAVLAAEAAIAWLRSRSDANDEHHMPGRPEVREPLSPRDQEGVTRTVSWLERLLGGGLGYSTLAVDRLATMIRLVWRCDEAFGAKVLEHVVTNITTDACGNLALRSLDRCVRAAARAAAENPGRNADQARLIDAISTIAQGAVIGDDDTTGPDLWVPDVFTVRLARVLAHFSSHRSIWADWIRDRALDDEHADIGTRRACVWSIAETTLTPDGLSRWNELAELLGAHPEFRDLFDNFRQAPLTDLVAAAPPSRANTPAAKRGNDPTREPLPIPTCDGWYDLVTVPLVVELEPLGTSCPDPADNPLRWTVGGAAGDLLLEHLPDSIATLTKPGERHPTPKPGIPSISADAAQQGTELWRSSTRAVAAATRNLLREAFTTPSAIRVRTANEVLDAAGHTVRGIALHVTAQVFAELLVSDPDTYPEWLWERAIHLATLRGGPTLTAPAEPLRSWETELRTFLTDGCMAVLARDDLSPFTRGRALWSVGDLLDKQFPPRPLVEAISELAADPAQPPPVRVSAIRALGLLHRPSSQGVLDKLAAEDTLTGSEKRMLRWAMAWYTTPFGTVGSTV